MGRAWPANGGCVLSLRRKTPKSRRRRPLLSKEPGRRRADRTTQIAVRGCRASVRFSASSAKKRTERYLSLGTERPREALISNSSKYLKAHRLAGPKRHSGLPYHSRVPSQPLISLRTGGALIAPGLAEPLRNARAAKSNFVEMRLQPGGQNATVASRDSFGGVARGDWWHFTRGRLRDSTYDAGNSQLEWPSGAGIFFLRLARADAHAWGQGRCGV